MTDQAKLNKLKRLLAMGEIAKCETLEKYYRKIDMNFEADVFKEATDWLKDWANIEPSKRPDHNGEPK